MVTGKELIYSMVGYPIHAVKTAFDEAVFGGKTLLSETKQIAAGEMAISIPVKEISRGIKYRSERLSIQATIRALGDSRLRDASDPFDHRSLPDEAFSWKRGDLQWAEEAERRQIQAIAKDDVPGQIINGFRAVQSTALGKANLALAKASAGFAETAGKVDVVARAQEFARKAAVRNELIIGPMAAVLIITLAENLSPAGLQEPSRESLEISTETTALILGDPNPESLKATVSPYLIRASQGTSNSPKIRTSEEIEKVRLEITGYLGRNRQRRNSLERALTDLEIPEDLQQAAFESGMAQGKLEAFRRNNGPMAEIPEDLRLRGPLQRIQLAK